VSAPGFRVGDVPRPQSVRDRRRELAQLAADAANPPNSRPVEEERPGRFDRCRQSKYQTHRFGSSGGRRCDFCGRAWRDCLVKR